MYGISAVHVLKRGCTGTSETEWSVVKLSRDKKKIKEYFERVRLCALRVARRV